MALGSAGAAAAESEPEVAPCDGFSKLIERPTGEILGLGGFCGGAGTPAFMQFDADGHLDRSFGEEGFVNRSGSGVIVDLLLRPDGATILVQEDGMTAYDSSGQPLMAFGEAGSVTFLDEVPGGPNPVTAAALQADGKVLVSGVSPAAPVVSRFTTSGEADSGFGLAGTTVVNLSMPSGGGQPAFGSNGVIVSGNDGSVYLAFWFLSGEDEEYWQKAWATTVVKLDSGGTVDSSYGAGGFAISKGFYGDQTWEPRGIAVDGKGAVHLSTLVYGLEVKPYLSSRRFRFDPDGGSSRVSNDAYKPSGFDSNLSTLLTGIYDGPYSDLSYNPFFNFGLSYATPNSRYVFTGLIGTGASTSTAAVQSADGQYLVGGHALSNKCEDVYSQIGCHRSLVLLKLNRMGKLDSTFGQKAGATTYPEIKCPLGMSSDEALGQPARFRCRQPLPKFRMKATISKGRTHRPALRLLLDDLPDADAVLASGGSLKVKLPKALRTRRGVVRKGLKVRIQTPDCLGYCAETPQPVGLSKGTIRIQLGDSLPVLPYRIEIRIKRGYLKKIARRHHSRPLKFRTSLSLLSIPDWETLTGSLEYKRDQTTSTRVRKPGRGGSR